MEGIIHDLRFGARTLWRNPGFTLIVVVTLALGIGANAAVLTVTTNTLLRELPFPESDRIMVLWRDTPRLIRGAISIPTFVDLHQRNRSFEHLALFRSSGVNLVADDGEAERATGLMVSSEFASALGVEPVLGRNFKPEDDRLGAPRTVILGHELWLRRFGGDRQIIGESLRLNNEIHTVIGVFPAGLQPERLGEHGQIGDLWLPIGIFYDRLPKEERAARDFEVLGRLAPGTSVSSATEDLARITRELAQEYPDTYVGNLFTGAPLAQDQVSEVRPVLLTLLAAVGFVLLITCSNLINLQMTRNTVRDHELATRAALGAGRWHLIRQLAIEGLLLALPGGVLGLLIGQLYLRSLPHFMAGVSYIDEARIDQPTIVLTFLVTIVIGLLIGLIPALQAIRSLRRADIARRGLQTRGGVLPQQRLRQALTISELALAVVLLIGAGLMLRTLQALSTQDTGFEHDRLLTLKVALPQEKYEQSFPWLSYFDKALERVRTLPGVENAAVTSLRPMDDYAISIVAAEDREVPKTKDMELATFQVVSPEFFRTLGVPLLEGRDFNQHDHDRNDSEPVVVISHSLAQIFWPDESPLGKLFAFEFLGSAEEPEPQWRRIVGVVGDIRNRQLSIEPGPTAYGPHTQRSPYFEESPIMSLMVRTRTEPFDQVAPVRDTLLAIDPHQPVFSTRTMTDLLADELDQPRLVSLQLTTFATLALVLAIVGVYGVVARSVAARTREIGTRMALGATRYQICVAFLSRGLAFVAIGVTVGWVAAALLTRLLTTMLYSVTATDPLIYLSVGLIMALVAFLATIIPTLRATAVNPAQALRYE